jgi:glycosyltransferase involved in cell wall biosynthesis
MPQTVKSILILGTRGVPANHGGFETFAERLALYLVARGWDVSVYCQEDVEIVTERIKVEDWRGVKRICIQTAATGPRATLEFDWRCIHDAVNRPGVCLVLGYNSGIFLPYLRLHGCKVLTNMDGIEWRRPKWSKPVRAWFWLNEWIAAWSSNRLVADHPAIADHLATRRPRSATVVIPYGGVPIDEASEAPLAALGLTPKGYVVSIARIEPDNNIHMLVEAFSQRPRGVQLVVLGNMNDDNAYHRKVRALASDEVIFPGAIYEFEVTKALRFHARAYLHGHTVGGTNPSLVEALWSGNAVVAHDNSYNRWTADVAGIYFKDTQSCADAIDRMLTDDSLNMFCGLAARQRASTTFQWNDVLGAYELECARLLRGKSRSAEIEAVVGISEPRWS